MRNLAIARNWRQKTLRNCRCKTGTFLEKIGGYFKLSGENILLSILPAFHPFLTLPNKTLRSEKGTFFSVWSDLFKSARKVPFLRFRNVPIKRAKRYLFCGWKQCSHNCGKGTLKINGVFKLYLKAVSNPTDWQMSTVWRHLLAAQKSPEVKFEILFALLQNSLLNHWTEPDWSL